MLCVFLIIISLTSVTQVTEMNRSRLKLACNVDNNCVLKLDPFLFLSAVSVGYIYRGCRQPFWEVQTVKMAGNDLMSSDIGGWNLDVHHTYSVQDGKFMNYTMTIRL